MVEVPGDGIHQGVESVEVSCGAEHGAPPTRRCRHRLTKFLQGAAHDVRPGEALDVVEVIVRVVAVDAVPQLVGDDAFLEGHEAKRGARIADAGAAHGGCVGAVDELFPGFQQQEPGVAAGDVEAAGHVFVDGDAVGVQHALEAAQSSAGGRDGFEGCRGGGFGEGAVAVGGEPRGIARVLDPVG